MWQVDLLFVQQDTPREIAIAGEGNATRVSVDVRRVLEKWPDAVFSLSILRADGAPYIAAVGMVPDNIGKVHYLLTPADVSLTGALRMEMDAVERDVRVISCQYTFWVLESMGDANPLLPPSPEVTWVDDVKQAAAIVDDRNHIDVTLKDVETVSGKLDSVGRFVQAVREVIDEGKWIW